MSSRPRLQWQDQAAETPPPLPVGAHGCANLPGQGLVVVCSPALLHDLATYFDEARRLERLALLLGRVWRGGGGGGDENLVLCVAGYRAVAAADSSAVHVRMAPRDWPGVWAGMGSRTIVGWAHSHPGHGLRPSLTDLATQRRWFRQPWALAVIVDPCAGTMATYAGKACVPVTPVLDAGLTALLS